MYFSTINGNKLIVLRTEAGGPGPFIHFEPLLILQFLFIDEYGTMKLIETLRYQLLYNTHS